MNRYTESYCAFICWLVVSILFGPNFSLAFNTWWLLPYKRYKSTKRMDVHFTRSGKQFISISNYRTILPCEVELMYLHQQASGKRGFQDNSVFSLWKPFFLILQGSMLPAAVPIILDVCRTSRFGKRGLGSFYVGLCEWIWVNSYL